MNDATLTMCHMAWDYPMFFMFTNAIGYCCRAPRINIDDTMLDQMGEDFWSNHPVFLKRRVDLVNGIKNEDCRTCWKLEEGGFKSSRGINYINHFMKKNDPSFPLALPINEYRNVPNIEQSNYSNVIEIVLNNTCDAKCTYCNEMYSTQWYAEKKKTNKVSASYVPQETRNYKAEEVFWKWYENKAIKTIRRFGFIGGEPFLIDALYECFDKLIEIHDRTSVAGDPVTGKVELCITSNMNTPPAYFEKFLSYIPRLEKHFTIIIQVSGENTGDDLEYIRHGVKWDRWSKNVEYLLANTTVTLNFLPCLSLMSIPRFHLYLEFYKEMCQKYRFMQIHNNIVTGPYEQSPMIAPKEFAQYFDKCIEIMQWVNENNKNQMITHALVTFIDWLKRTQNAISNNPSETEITENAIKFFQYFEDLDRVRRTNLLEVFPELTAFYKAGSNGIKSNNIIPIIAT